LLDWTSVVEPLIAKWEALVTQLGIKSPDKAILWIVTNKEVNDALLEKIKNRPGVLLSHGSCDSLVWSLSPPIASLASLSLLNQK